MPVPSAFGPNHAAVQAFIRQLDSVEWLSCVARAPDRPDADFVDFHFLARHTTDPWVPWGENLLSAESRFERLEFEHHRLGAHQAIQEAPKSLSYLRTSATSDDPFLLADDQFSNPATGYYLDTSSYPHELIDFPDRLVRGAALEVMVADLDPSLTFFDSVMNWFRRGRWPAGWSGSYPEGRILVW